MSAVDSSARAGFRIKGWHVLAGVSAFFAVVIAVDATFTVLALRTFPGQVSVTPYEDGLLYNRRIARLQAQERLGWRASAGAEPGQVVLVFRDREGRPLPRLTMTGRLQRPATEAGRIDLHFTETAPGRYVATTGRIAGAWDLTAEAQGASGGGFLAERRLTWP
ncbi:FixH family protein [Phenylobacterium sp.]|jgi:nitrogen fixation protein FixH|uniref:FixH family protein n=1 Tax=Phenylobacterium sp. TaxID=1871053 RepID=UPI002ED826CB